MSILVFRGFSTICGRSWAVKLDSIFSGLRLVGRGRHVASSTAVNDEEEELEDPESEDKLAIIFVRALTDKSTFRKDWCLADRGQGTLRIEAEDA